MVMKKLLLGCLSIVVVCMVSCCTTPTNSGSQGTLTPQIVSNLRPDSLSVLYFSFDSDGLIAASRANTDEWDIRLPFINADSRSVDVVLNSGTVNTNGKTVGVVVDSTFDLLTTAPADAQLRTDDTSSAKRVISTNLVGQGMFNYNGAQHTIVPNPQKTLVLKTRSGNYVKVQFVNLYKDAATSPTVLTPLGYYRLRYVKNTTRTLK